MTVIQTHGLTKRYGRVVAVEDLNLSVREGEVYGLLGPNGSGKTTTILMLLGLTEPTSGEARVLGFDPMREPLKVKSRVGYLPDQVGFYGELSAWENLRYTTRLLGLPDKEAEARIEEVLKRMGLWEVRDRKVAAFSRGMRQRLGLAEVLLKRPKVAILDEPTLGLDVNAQVAVREFIREYNRRYGATVLLTSHYMADIAALSERVLVIHQGRLLYDGALEGLLARFAPYREVRLTLGSPLPREALLPFGEVRALEGREGRLLVPRERLTERVAEILKRLPVEDLEVREPPLEEGIAKVFQSPKEAV